MNFWKEHFDHILLVLVFAGSGAAAIWTTAHNYDDASKWLFAQAAGALAALLMRMNRSAPAPPAEPEPQTTKETTP